MTRRLLQPDEVPNGIIAHLDHQTSQGDSKVLIECPDCHHSRWVRCALIRCGIVKTSLCRSCYLSHDRTSPLTPDEAPTVDTVLYFDRQEPFREKTGRQQQMMRILGECPDCHRQRWIRVNSIRNKKSRSTLCAHCKNVRSQYSATMAKGGYVISAGYRMIHINALAPEDKQLAEQHLRIHRNAYVYEHRFVALKTYGPSAVTPGSVIRHIDGNKLNNNPDNLIPGSQHDNRMDHVAITAEMKAWRGLALLLLRIIVDKGL